MTTKTKEKTIVFDKEEVAYNSPECHPVFAESQLKDFVLANGYIMLNAVSRVMLVTRATIGYAGGTLKSRKKMQEKIDNNPPRFDKILLPKKITKKKS